METVEPLQESRVFLKQLLSSSLKKQTPTVDIPIQKDAQVEALKRIIHELGIKVKTLTQALEEKKTEPSIQIVDLSEDLREQNQKTCELQSQLDQTLLENRKLTSEIEQITQKATTLELEYQQLQKEVTKPQIQSPPKDETESLYYNENRELKQKLVHFLSEKRQLETLCQKLENEKTSALLRIREYTTGCTDLELKVERLERDLHDTLQSLNEREETLESIKTSFEHVEKERAELLEQNGIQAKTIEDLTKQLSEETVKCLQFSQHFEDVHTLRTNLENLQNEHDTLQQKAKELDEHLHLLEQHLARRVKENAIFSEKLEDEKSLNALQSSKIQSYEILLQEKDDEITEIHKTLEQERSLYLEQEQTLKSQFEALLQKHDGLFQSWQAQAREIQQHKAMQERLKTLEELFDQVEKKLFSPQEQKEAFGE